MTSKQYVLSGTFGAWHRFHAKSRVEFFRRDIEDAELTATSDPNFDPETWVPAIKREDGSWARAAYKISGSLIRKSTLALAEKCGLKVIEQ